MALPTRQQIINALNNCLTPFANSMAAYLLETDPYLTPNDKDAMGAVSEIAAADKKYEHAISELILELDGIPQIGSVDPELSEMNYLSFPYLLDVMIEHEQKVIDRYRPLSALVPHYPDVKRLFQSILNDHEQLLEKLKGIRKSRYKSDEPETPAEETSEEATGEDAEPKAAPLGETPGEAAESGANEDSPSDADAAS
jgi:bacterioferritin (cytochrome b1)